MAAWEGTANSGGTLWEVAGLFLKLGIIGFGGPAAHIALMRQEVVHRRGWVTDAQFLDLLGATNLIPGPNSTEMAIHLGYRRAGWPGLLVAGITFIAPAALLVTFLAWAYVQFGAMPQVSWLMYGVKPAIMAVIAQAIWGLGRTAVKGPFTALLALAVLGLYLLGFNEIGLLLGAGVLMCLARGLLGPRTGLRLSAVAPLGVPGLIQLATPFSQGVLFLTFLKIGAVLYGSGYVLLAFLRADFVERLGWLTDAQLLDATAVGQITPGPVLTTATFVGYLLGGPVGALLATAGIFLPSFVFVAAIGPLVPRLRGSPWAGSFLDGVNAAALGLMTAVALELGRAVLVDAVTVLTALGSAVALIRFKANPVWLVAAGGLVGLTAHALGPAP